MIARRSGVAFLIVAALAGCSAEPRRDIASADLCADDGEGPVAASIVFADEARICAVDHGRDWISAARLVAQTPNSRADFLQRRGLWWRQVSRGDIGYWGERTSGEITFFTSARAVEAGQSRVLVLDDDLMLECTPVSALRLYRLRAAEHEDPSTCVWELRVDTEVAVEQESH